MSQSILIKAGSILGASPADVLIKDGVISEIGNNLSSDGAEVIEASGMVLMPGFVDLHNTSS